MPEIIIQGRVLPSRQITIFPQVSGVITELDGQTVPGGVVNLGQSLISIEDSDYRFIVQQREAELASASAELQQEQGRQAKARKELRDFTESQQRSLDEANTALILRQPQLTIAKANLASAQVQLRQAKLNLARTEIVAPFDGVVVSRSVNLGSKVNEATELLQLLNTDEFWLQAAIPVEQLKWIQFADSSHQQGSVAKIQEPHLWPQDQFRLAEVFKLLPQLDENTRQAQILIRIVDPLLLSHDNNSAAPKIMVNDYLQARIEGREINRVVSLDRRLLRKGDNVWLMDEQDRFAVRSVNVIFRDSKRVLVDRGLNPGERIITSDLSTPVEGVALTTDFPGNVSARVDHREEHD